jgi:fumarate hydratase subunit beta
MTGASSIRSNAAVSEVHHLQLPLSEADVRRLQLGDMVYLSGELVMTAGLPTHQRILEHINAGKPLPIELLNGTLLQFGSYSTEEQGRLKVVYMNPTTSTRFNPLMPTIIRSQQLRAVGGKGGLDATCAQAMRETGCVYLSFPGGGCTLFSQAIREVVAVAWSDLIVHYRLVKLRVENLGPGTVGIDAHGNSLYEGLQKTAQSRVSAIMAQLNADRATLTGPEAVK